FPPLVVPGRAVGLPVNEPPRVAVAEGAGAGILILSPILRASQFLLRLAFCSSSSVTLFAAAMVEQKSPALMTYSEAAAVGAEAIGVIAPALPPVRMTSLPWIL